MRREPAAFRLWLSRDLKAQFGTVIREPLPEDLVALVEALPLED